MGGGGLLADLGTNLERKRTRTEFEGVCFTLLCMDLSKDWHRWRMIQASARALPGKVSVLPRVLSDWGPPALWG